MSGKFFDLPGHCPEAVHWNVPSCGVMLVRHASQAKVWTLECVAETDKVMVACFAHFNCQHVYFLDAQANNGFIGEPPASNAFANCFRYGGVSALENIALTHKGKVENQTAIGMTPNLGDPAFAFIDVLDKAELCLVDYQWCTTFTISTTSARAANATINQDVARR